MKKTLKRTRLISFKIGKYRFLVEKHVWFYPLNKEVIKSVKRLTRATQKAGILLGKGSKKHTKK